MWLLLREFTDGQNPSVSSHNQRVFSGQKSQTVPKLEIMGRKSQKVVLKRLGVLKTVVMWLLLREFTDGQNPSVSSSNQRVFSGQKPQTVPKLEIIRFKIQKFVVLKRLGYLKRLYVAAC